MADIKVIYDDFQNPIPERFKSPLLQKQGVISWAKSFLSSPIPLLLLDMNLRIIWCNNKFKLLFGDCKTLITLPINKFFTNSLDGKKTSELYQNIKSSKYGYSWRLNVEKKGIKELSIISNLLIIPIFESPQATKAPIAYACILDNISDEYKNMLKGFFLSLLEASRLKDNDTGNHIQRVNRYAQIIALQLNKDSRYKNVDREFIENIGFLAALHDIGKLGTPDDILNKKGNLSEWEKGIMQEHTINGAFILNTYPNPMAKKIALYHHEKWDGSGYPYGLKEDMIPLCARIVALCDIYDALRMKRSYKEGMSHKKAYDLIIMQKQKQLDPYLVDYFIKVEKDFERIFSELKDKVN